MHISNTKSQIEQNTTKTIRVQHNSWPIKDQAILEEFFGKIPNHEMEIKLGRKWHTIEEYARRRGLSLNNFKDERGKTINNKNKPSLYPLTLEENQSYYWMGYLLADGYMDKDSGQIVVCAAVADKEHLLKYAEYLNAKVKIYFYKFNKISEPQETARVGVGDIINAKIIETKFDWKNNKTYNPPEIKILSETLDTYEKFLSYLIGFIDGDGCIEKKQLICRIVNHASYLEVYNYFINKCVEYDIIKTKTRPRINGRGYADFCFPKSAVMKLKKFIDSSSLLILDRKWKPVK